MTFQISKLKTQMRQSQIVAWVIAAVLWLQDLYIAVLAMASRVWLYTLVAFINLISRFKRPRQHLIYATSHQSGADITLAIKCYYACDKLKSCGSLYRWLSRFGEVDPQINLVFAVDNNICAARINIDDDIEELTSSPLDDLSPDTLPMINIRRVCAPHREKTIRVVNIRSAGDNIRTSRASDDESQNDYHQKMCEHDD